MHPTFWTVLAESLILNESESELEGWFLMRGLGDLKSQATCFSGAGARIFMHASLHVLVATRLT